MDPNATLSLAANAALERDYATVREHLDALAEWRERGGFAPTPLARDSHGAYALACAQATISQGLVPILDALSAAGFADAYADQTGGFCMVATVVGADRVVTITDEDGICAVAWTREDFDAGEWRDDFPAEDGLSIADAVAFAIEHAPDARKAGE